LNEIKKRYRFGGASSFCSSIGGVKMSEKDPKPVLPREKTWEVDKTPFEGGYLVEKKPQPKPEVSGEPSGSSAKPYPNP
jgi:hypothetical protein